MIEFLNIDETYYVEDDELKMKINESKLPQEGSWDDIWDGVLEIIQKAREFDEKHNNNNIPK